MSWQEVVVKDVCESIVDCVNKTAPVVDYETPYKMIRTTNVRHGVIDTENTRFVTEETFEKWTRRLLPQAGDVILTREAPLGEVGMLKNSEEKIFLGQRLMQFRVDEKKLDNYFLLYSLQGSYMQGQLQAASSGSTVAHVRVGDVENLKIKLPSIDEQKRIAGILKAYEDLIENNNRRIQILETIAQKLYQEWFIHYRFPGHQQTQWQETEQGKIPVGWEVKASSEVIEFAPRMRLPKEGLKPFVSMPNVSTSSMVIDEIEWREGNSGTKFQNGDTLLARITPCLQNGKTAFVQFLDEEHPIGLGSTEFIVMRSKTLTPEFVYCLARSAPFRGHAINSMAGADGRQRVKNDCFDAYYLAVPPQKLLDDFSAIAEPLFKQVFALSKKNKNLKRQRDLLLPKLINNK